MAAHSPAEKHSILRGFSLHHLAALPKEAKMDAKPLPLSGTATMHLIGRVEKLIDGTRSGTPNQVQIVVEGAEELYGELRVANVLQNERGEKVALMPGAEIEITMTVNVKSTTPQG